MPQNNTNRWSDCVERNSTVLYRVWEERVAVKKKKKKSKKQQLLTLGENNFVQEKEYFVSNIYIEIIHVNTECSSFQILWENCTEKNKKKEKKEWRKEGRGTVFSNARSGQRWL